MEIISQDTIKLIVGIIIAIVLIGIGMKFVKGVLKLGLLVICCVVVYGLIDTVRVREVSPEEFLTSQGEKVDDTTFITVDGIQIPSNVEKVQKTLTGKMYILLDNGEELEVKGKGITEIFKSKENLKSTKEIQDDIKAFIGSFTEEETK